MTAVFARRLVAGLFICIVSPIALAHPEGHGAHDFLAGFTHPFTGIDHLLAMFAVGLWAVRCGRGAVLALPLVFPLTMIGGALFALNGIGLPAIEPMIAVSVMTLGLLVAIGLRLPVFASAALVATFAIFHGYAHGAESNASQLGIYALGFVSATVILHALGVAAGILMARHSSANTSALTSRVAGSMIAATGAVSLLF